MKNSNGNNKMTKSKIAFLLTFFALSIVAVVFSVLCIHNTTIAFLQQNALLFSILAGVAICVFFAFSVWFLMADKETLTKGFVSLYIFLDFLLIFIYVLHETGFFSVIKDAKALEEWLQKSGSWMSIAYIVLQFLQVIILPIPSNVSTLVGVALFGPFQAMLYSLIGIIPASLFAFFVGRKLGGKAVSWMVGDDTLKLWQSKLKGKDNFFLSVLFLLPFFPDDVLCFIAGLSTMRGKYFFIMIVITRAISVSTTCYLTNFIPFTTWWGLLIWALLIIGIGLLVLLVYKNLEKLQAWLKSIKK